MIIRPFNAAHLLLLALAAGAVVLLWVLLHFIPRRSAGRGSGPMRKRAGR